MSVSYDTTYMYPRQKLPRSKKDKAWGVACVDWILNAQSSNIYDHAINKKANYDLYNNIISREDFKYVTNPYGLDDEFPARLHNYNIITPKLNLLAGEEMKRPFNFRVAAVNSDAVSQLQEKRKQLLLEYLESELINELVGMGVNVTDPNTGETMTPEQVEKYLNYTESDIRESTANKIANYLVKKENLEFKFNKGFKDALIAGEEFFYIGIDGDEPICESVNPLDFDYDKNPDIDFVQDGQWARHTKYCTPSEILDFYHDDLTDDDISQIDSGDFGGTTANHATLSANMTPNSFNYHTEMAATYIPVTRVEWKSMRKIGFLTYYDENLEEQETIVDETYKIQSDLGERIEWKWINEVWEGTKIGESIYARIRPKRVQYRTMDNPSICKLGYVGAVYNNRNSRSTSLIDLVKHHQYLYNVIMYRMEFEIAKAKGKKMVMDIAQIPRSQGMDLDKWMYYFDSMGLAFINSFEEGKGKFAGQVSAFNQFTAVDMSLSQAVGQYIGILNKIEEQVESLMGVSRQRQGSISSSETVGGVERAVVQSSHITEPLFYMHNEVKKHVLSQLIETAKIVYPEGKKVNYILDDMNRVMLSISDQFINADYGVFVTNSAKEVRALEDLRSMAQQAAASGLMTLTDLVTIFDSNSMADIKSVVKKSEANRQEEAEAERQSQMELQQQQFQAQMEIEEAKADRLDNREYIKGELAKEREMIKALGFAQDQDTNSNNIPDVLEYDKLVLSATESKNKKDTEDKKINLEEEKLKVQERIADKANASKEKIARMKPKPTSSSKK